ncbi:hypothetical protein EW146_g3834 [Bondarzewia mesenterica]|uniref:Uncharacterized protein n=1 Tax=Bondarzewia mesenterica TaxID=1095465 RepID=A0A4V3XFB7_9AGAM|nr:hypothetical protein EW146_g3834 [Bondarzewia mesenterica]
MLFHSGPQPPSSVHLLPVELLSRIFVFGFQSAVDLDHPFKRAAFEPALNFEVLVSHVCRHWRQVALNTPSLWTNIRMRKPSHLERSTEFIRRSRTKLLDILIDTVAMSDHVEGHTLCKHEFHPAYDIIDPHSERWHSLVLKVADLVCKQGARDRLHTTGPVPNLEIVQLWHLEDWLSAQTLAVQTAKPPVKVLREAAIGLKDLSLVGVNLAWSHEQTPYLAGLRTLELKLHAEGTRPTWPEWEAILRACPDLERLALHYSGPREVGSWSTDPIPLLKLRDLSLADLDADLLCVIIRNMAIPAVRFLELELPDQDFTSFVETIAEVRFGRASVCGLEVSAYRWDTWSERELSRSAASSVPNGFPRYFSSPPPPPDDPNSQRWQEQTKSSSASPNVPASPIKPSSPMTVTSPLPSPFSPAPPHSSSPKLPSSPLPLMPSPKPTPTSSFPTPSPFFSHVTTCALAAGIPVCGYVSIAIACPYTGPVPSCTIADVARALLDMSCYQVSLSDTTGTGMPSTISAMLDAILAQYPISQLAIRPPPPSNSLSTHTPFLPI